MKLKSIPILDDIGVWSGFPVLVWNTTLPERVMEVEFTTYILYWVFGKWLLYPFRACHPRNHDCSREITVYIACTVLY